MISINQPTIQFIRICFSFLFRLSISYIYIYLYSHSLGLSALLLQMHSNWTNIQLREALIQSASHPNRLDKFCGWGIANATAASLYQSQSIDECPSNCYDSGEDSAIVDSQGTCNNSTGRCECKPGYYDIDCRYRKSKYSLVVDYTIL